MYICFIATFIAIHFPPQPPKSS
jgi:hypothetical protein